MMNETLVLEVNDRHVENTGIINEHLAITPPIDEDYWYFRVGLSKTQAILGFPKFFTSIGIGFAEEEDWNANLPFQCSAEEIYAHIEHNKGGDAISKEDCIQAIEMIREAARRFKGWSDEEWLAEQNRMATR